jgi:hypothetical protein
MGATLLVVQVERSIESVKFTANFSMLGFEVRDLVLTVCSTTALRMYLSTINVKSIICDSCYFRYQGNGKDYIVKILFGLG